MAQTIMFPLKWLWWRFLLQSPMGWTPLLSARQCHSEVPKSGWRRRAIYDSYHCYHTPSLNRHPVGIQKRVQGVLYHPIALGQVATLRSSLSNWVEESKRMCWQRHNYICLIIITNRIY